MKEKKHVTVTVEDVLADMTFGEQYTAHDIARKFKISAPSARALMIKAMVARKVSVTVKHRRNLYSLVVADQLEERERVALPGWSPDILQGYDATIRRFQNLCVASRQPLQVRSQLVRVERSGTPNDSGSRAKGHASGRYRVGGADHADCRTDGLDQSERI